MIPNPCFLEIDVHCHYGELYFWENLLYFGFQQRGYMVMQEIADDEAAGAWCCGEVVSGVGEGNREKDITSLNKLPSTLLPYFTKMTESP